MLLIESQLLFRDIESQPGQGGSRYGLGYAHKDIVQHGLFQEAHALHIVLSALAGISHDEASSHLDPHPPGQLYGPEVVFPGDSLFHGFKHGIASALQSKEHPADGVVPHRFENGLIHQVHPHVRHGEVPLA